MKETLDHLKAGAGKFRSEVYPAKAALYREAVSKPQKPHSLFITCSDSRINAEAITSSGTGDIFITRNVGNLVPAYGETIGGSVAAVIEYAVAALKVKHIVVCGHSDCGAMKALMHPEAMDTLPAVRSWMRNSSSAISSARSAAKPDEEPGDLAKRLTEENVLLQLQNLKTHPAVSAAMGRGELTISGWVYDIGAGEVRIAEDGSRTFQTVAAQQAVEQTA